MKNLFFILLVLFLYACTNEYIIQANLGIVSDKDFARLNWDKRNKGINKDSIFSNFNSRKLYLTYFVVNESSDSVFIPIGYPLPLSLSANIDSRDSLKTSIWIPGKASYCNTQDTVYFSFYLNIESKNNKDREWLQKTHTKELLSKIHINMVKSAENIDRIPNIVFNNDTTNININPVIVFRKNNKPMVIYDNDSLVVSTGEE